jgi:hypothetical protein
MREKCVHELIVRFDTFIKQTHTTMSTLDLDLNADLDLDLNADLDLDLDNYLLHPQPAPCIRIVHAFMHNRSVEHVCEETVRIEDGVLRQEQLIWCIKQQQQQQRTLSRMHFKLRAMFLYNMDLEAEEVRDFLKTNQLMEKQSPHAQRFLMPISAVEDVVIQPTIPMFARLNALHIMYEASNHLGNKHNQSNQSKKRVIIHSKKHKHARTKNKTVMQNGLELSIS